MLAFVLEIMVWNLMANAYACNLKHLNLFFKFRSHTCTIQVFCWNLHPWHRFLWNVCMYLFCKNLFYNLWIFRIVSSGVRTSCKKSYLRKRHQNVNQGKQHIHECATYLSFFGYFCMIFCMKFFFVSTSSRKNEIESD